MGVKEFNQRKGRHMRCCEICEVGMGLMTLQQYRNRFINHSGRCPICFHTAIKPPEKKPENWLTMTDARNRYKIKGLRSLINKGTIAFKHQGVHTILVKESDVKQYIDRNQKEEKEKKIYEKS